MTVGRQAKRGCAVAMKKHKRIELLAVPCEQPVYISSEQLTMARVQAETDRPTKSMKEEKARRVKALFVKPKKAHV